MNQDNPSCDPVGVARLVATGDDTALGRMTECYLGHLLTVGRCSCRDPDRAADAVHDALLSAAERLGQFRGDGSVKAWLSRMVVNACRCQERGRKNDPAWNVELTDELAQDRRGPEESAARAELVEELSKALSKLAASDRSLFLLSQVDRISAPELAATFAISPQAVRARLTRLRRRLRAELSDVWREWADSTATR